MRITKAEILKQVEHAETLLAQAKLVAQDQFRDLQDAAAEHEKLSVELNSVRADAERCHAKNQELMQEILERDQRLEDNQRWHDHLKNYPPHPLAPTIGEAIALSWSLFAEAVEATWHRYTTPKGDSPDA